MATTAIGTRSRATAEWREQEFGLDIKHCLDPLLRRLPEDDRSTHQVLQRDVELGFERFAWAAAGGAYCAVKVPVTFSIMAVAAVSGFVVHCYYAVSKRAGVYDSFVRSLLRSKSNRMLLYDEADVVFPESQDAEHVAGRQVSRILSGRREVSEPVGEPQLIPPSTSERGL